MKKSTGPDGADKSTVGFRLDKVSTQTLRDRAAALGISHHELARNYVSQMLNEAGDRKALRAKSESMHQEIAELREDFALAVETLLVMAGKAKKEDAQAWVAGNFRRK